MLSHSLISERFKPCPVPERKKVPVSPTKIINLEEIGPSENKNMHENTSENRPSSYTDKHPREKSTVYDVHRKGSLKLVIKSSPKHTPEYGDGNSSPMRELKKEENTEKDYRTVPFKEGFKRKSHVEINGTSDDEIPPKFIKAKDAQQEKQEKSVSKPGEAFHGVVVKTEPEAFKSDQTLPFSSYSQDKVKQEDDQEPEDLYDFEKSDMDYALEDYAHNIDDSLNSDTMNDSAKFEDATHVEHDNFIDDFLNSETGLDPGSVNVQPKSESSPSSTNNTCSYGNFSPITPEEKFSGHFLSSKDNVQSKRDPAEMQSAINSILDVDMGCEQLESNVTDTTMRDVFVNSSQEVADDDLDAAINSIL